MLLLLAMPQAKTEKSTGAYSRKHKQKITFLQSIQSYSAKAKQKLLVTQINIKEVPRFLQSQVLLIALQFVEAASHLKLQLNSLTLAAIEIFF